MHRNRKTLPLFLVLSVFLHLFIFRGLFMSELIRVLFDQSDPFLEPITLEFLEPPREQVENPEARRLAAATHRTQREQAPQDTGGQGAVALMNPRTRSEGRGGDVPDVRRIIPDYHDFLKPGMKGTRARFREETVSLNTQEFRYISYFSKIKDRIEMNWNYPMLAQVRGQQGDLLLRFTIAREGDVERIVLLKGSGHPLLDEAAIAAIRKAAPFPPIPVRLELDRLNILATFEYILGYRSVR